MGYLLQQLPTVLALGSLYALAACGYTLIHATTRQFNLAIGAVYVAGGYAAFIAMTLLDVAGLAFGFGMYAATLAIGVAVAGASGAALHPLSAPDAKRQRNPVAPLVATVGLWIAAAEGVRLLSHSHTLFAPSPLPGQVSLGAALTMPLAQAAILPVAALALGALLWVVARTSLGRSLRAVADDAAMAALLGHSPARTVAIAYVLGAGLIGLAGALAAARYGAVWPYMGLVFGLKAIAAAVIGGIGSPAGAILGAVLIAATETLWSAYLAGDYRDIVVLALLVGTLIFRPDGLLSRPVSDAAAGAGGARR